MKFPFPEKIPMTLCILAAAAVALLLLLPGTAGDSGIQTAVTRLESEDTQEYVENLENRLSALLCSIDGVSELSVMVTLESGVEYVYATEQKSNVNLLSDTLSGTEKRVENQNDTEASYIILKDASGGESAVLVKRLEPVVQAVAIVCRGAQDNVICQKLLETAATALGVPTSRVSVVAK